MNGRLWRLSIKTSDGEYVRFAGAKEESFTISNGSRDRSGKETDGYRHILAEGNQSCDLSVSGVATVNDAYRKLRAAVRDNELVDMKAESVDEVITGEFHVGSWQQSAPHDNAVTFSASFASSGKFLIEDNA